MAKFKGTPSDDMIDASADPDQIDGAGGNDVVCGHDGNDMIDGNHGDDSILGGAGDDTLFGGDGANRWADRVAFQWSDIPDPHNGGLIDDRDRITTGSQSVNDVDVSYHVTPGIGRFENETQYTKGIDAGDKTIDNHSAVDISDSGSVNVEFSEAVENAEFRINNFDAYNEHLVLRAYDADGNQIEFTATPGSNGGGTDTDTIKGADTFEGLGGKYDDDDPEGSLLVQIPGPVARIEMDFTSVNNWTLTITDIYFDDPASVIEAEAGGADTLEGGEGDDLLTGGDGNDVFVLTDGGGHDIITDFDLGDADGDGRTNDQIAISGMTDSDGNPVNAWDVVVTDDGSGNAVLTFPNGESVTMLGVAPAQMATATQRNASGIPCFTSGAAILTPAGEVPIEILRPGDLVITRGNGPQPLVWIAQRRLDFAALSAQPNLRPVLIREGILGAARDILVSPQHGMLINQDGGTQSLIRAKHLIDVPTSRARIANGRREVTYVHLMFEQHQIIFSDGAACESFYPGPVGMDALDAASRIELLTLFPELARLLADPKGQNPYGATARAVLTRKAIRDSGQRLHLAVQSRRSAGPAQIQRS